MSRAILLLCGLLGLSSFGRSAVAQPPSDSARLELSGSAETASCMSGARLEREVERRLERKVFGGVAPALVVRVQYERDGDVWRATLELGDAAGRLGGREISTRARHCSALDDSLALVVALLVDTPPIRETPAPEVSPAPAAAGAPRPRPPLKPTSIRVPADTIAPREPPSVGMRASLLAAQGLLPEVTVGFELAAELRIARLPRLVGFVQALLPGEAALEGRDAGARVTLGRLGLEVCPELASWSGAVVEACGGQAVGRMVAEGFGFERNVQQDRLYFGLLAGADVRLSLATWLDLVAGMRAEFPITRDDFGGRAADGQAISVFQPAVAAGVVRLGAGAHF